MLLGLLIGGALGVLGGRTHYCFMGAISDAVLFDSARRLRAWGWALAVALIGVQALAHLGLPLDAGAAPAAWPGVFLGGLAFGVGMVLAGGCAFRNLVRAGGGSLRAALVVLVMGLCVWGGTALGLAPLPQTPPTDGGGAWRPVLALALAAGLAWYGWHEPRRAARREAMLIGGAFGLAVTACFAAAWALGGGAEGLAPALGVGGIAALLAGREAGQTVNVGVAPGILAGALALAVWQRSWRPDRFVDRGDALRHLVGGALMGLGAAAAHGCTLGQGLSGPASLAPAALAAATGIVLGAFLALRYLLHGPGLGLGLGGGGT